MRFLRHAALLAVLPLLGCATVPGTYERVDQRRSDPPGTIQVLTLDADGYYTQTVTGAAPRTTTGVYTLKNEVLTLRAAGGGVATYRCVPQQGDLLITPIDAPGGQSITVRLVRTGTYGAR